MNPEKQNRDVARALMLVTQLGVNMLVPIFLCLFVGQWLDKKLGTQFLTIIFIFVGILTAYRNFYVVLKPMLKGKKEKADEEFWKSQEQASGKDVEKQEDAQDKK